jgi:hypothetical protein
MGLLWREIPVYRTIFTYLLKYLFIAKALRKERPSMFPKTEAPMGTDAHSRALLTISFGVPSKGALPPVPPHGITSGGGGRGEREMPRS